MPWGEVELEPEVAGWLESLDDRHWAHVLFRLDLLAERGALLGEPHTRQLSGRLRVLRGGQHSRITYWITPGRRIIALTVLATDGADEKAEIARASRAMASAGTPGTFRHGTPDGVRASSGGGEDDRSR